MVKSISRSLAVKPIPKEWVTVEGPKLGLPVARKERSRARFGVELAWGAMVKGSVFELEKIRGE